MECYRCRGNWAALNYDNTRKKEKKERKEGRKEGRKKERKEGRKKTLKIF